MNNQLTLSSYSQNALSAFAARHSAADSALWNSAGFYWDDFTHVFKVTVRDFIVLESSDFSTVKRFVEAHNSHLSWHSV